ncbi:hypothetical protein ACIBCT_09085 [Streptosporangium sp. NPDC050855]|uniref:hypothetical protein n=1 Tax=Streptosporangium sp. NPDC050855 TaxID=3366194 RepID=UPI0037B9ABF2
MKKDHAADGACFSPAYLNAHQGVEEAHHEFHHDGRFLDGHRMSRVFRHDPLFHPRDDLKKGGGRSSREDGSRRRNMG